MQPVSSTNFTPLVKFLQNVGRDYNKKNFHTAFKRDTKYEQCTRIGSYTKKGVTVHQILRVSFFSFECYFLNFFRLCSICYGTKTRYGITLSYTHNFIEEQLSILTHSSLKLGSNVVFFSNNFFFSISFDILIATWPVMFISFSPLTAYHMRMAKLEVKLYKKLYLQHLSYKKCIVAFLPITRFKYMGV